MRQRSAYRPTYLARRERYAAHAEHPAVSSSVKYMLRSVMHAPVQNTSFCVQRREQHSGAAREGGESVCVCECE